MTEKTTHQRDARKHLSLAVCFALLLSRRGKARYCNISPSSCCQQGQRTPGLSVTVSLSTETLLGLEAMLG